MIGSIQTPARGEKIRASWGAAITERVNAIAPIGGEVLVRDGATGIGFAPLPANRRLRRGTKTPGNFEPVFAEEEVESGSSTPPRLVLDSVGVGFYPFGCRFIRSDNMTIDESAKIAHGMIWLEIVVSASGNNHTATIKGESYEEEEEEESGEEEESEEEEEPEEEEEEEGEPDSDPFVNDGTNGKFQIPLYEIKNGAIKTDFRSCMSLPIRIY